MSAIPAHVSADLASGWIPSGWAVEVIWQRASAAVGCARQAGSVAGELGSCLNAGLAEPAGSLVWDPGR
jgi:hypothetical protein